ncbi:MAG: HEPN domain-containing protein [Pedobacter sp.]|nr:MAG: HEPN domain-containing protein [Pedobacter sp.]
MSENLNIPNHQLIHLTAFVTKLAERFQPLHIYSFGYNSTSTTSNGCFTTEESRQEHQHFLFVITETNTRIDHEVQEFANAHFKEGTITVICHGILNVTEGIHSSHRFFRMILFWGQALYSNGALPPKFTFNDEDNHYKVESVKHYHQREALAVGFLKAAQLSLKEANYAVSVFLMHQCVEQCTIMLIQVYTGYRSQLHNLKRQLQLCNCFSRAPYKHLLSGGSESERLFEILVSSYTKARYKDDFFVEQTDAEALFTRVSTFTKLTEILCKIKLGE